MQICTLEACWAAAVAVWKRCSGPVCSAGKELVQFLWEWPAVELSSLEGSVYGSPFKAGAPVCLAILKAWLASSSHSQLCVLAVSAALQVFSHDTLLWCAAARVWKVCSWDSLPAAPRVRVCPASPNIF